MKTQFLRLSLLTGLLLTGAGISVGAEAAPATPVTPAPKSTPAVPRPSTTEKKATPAATTPTPAAPAPPAPPPATYTVSTPAEMTREFGEQSKDLVDKRKALIDRLRLANTEEEKQRILAELRQQQQQRVEQQRELARQIREQMQNKRTDVRPAGPGK